MLYKLAAEGGIFNELSPMEFHDFGALGKREKELENLIANNLFEVLFEDASLMPIFQERTRQSVADIYALDETGGLTIFELKRGDAGGDAVLQALRYAQNAGDWRYRALEEKYKKYMGDDSVALNDGHKEHFYLEEPLGPEEFNGEQNLIVIGSAADEVLVRRVDYWKKKGISIEFLPYRLYDIGGEKFFEFFSPPYDRHINPAHQKGVLFDTNRTYDKDAIWYMMENRRVAAFGGRKDAVNHLKRGDIVFFSHVGVGIVAAGSVRSERKIDDGYGDDCWYRDVEFLTSVPKRGENLRALPFWEVREITGKSFRWARIIKVPYLSRDEAENLVERLSEL